MNKLSRVPGICFYLLIFCFIPILANADVPEDYRNLVNPMELSADQIPYWKKQYSAQCSRCHGESGDGGEKVEKGYPQPLNFTDKQLMDTKTDGELFYQIEIGGEDDSAMPDFGPDSALGWDEEKIWQMVTFIRLFSK